MIYLNEFDPFAAEWLNRLSFFGEIPLAYIDRRTIKDVTADDVRSFTQCHFFAGIGGWLEALRIAGWPAGRSVWTGSCPCQPFSNSGRMGGVSDERHLWPWFFSLIKQCRPSVVFGEQVESPLGRAWLASVLDDLEGIGYSVAASGLPAACVGPPQGRPRLWWVADSNDSGRQRSIWSGESEKTREERKTARRESLRSACRYWPPGPGEVDSIPLLANGLPGVMGACKGYGNAIVPQVAAAFITAFMEATGQ